MVGGTSASTTVFELGAHHGIGQSHEVSAAHVMMYAEPCTCARTLRVVNEISCACLAIRNRTLYRVSDSIAVQYSCAPTLSEMTRLSLSGGCLFWAANLLNLCVISCLTIQTNGVTDPSHHSFGCWMGRHELTSGFNRLTAQSTGACRQRDTSYRAALGAELY